jgi:hypothetical protein
LSAFVKKKLQSADKPESGYVRQPHVQNVMKKQTVSDIENQSQEFNNSSSSDTEGSSHYAKVAQENIYSQQIK